MHTLRSYLPWQNFNEFFVSIVYFVQGSAGITAIASALILREEMGLDFYQIGLIGVAGTLPWSIKPVFGLLTDLVPIGMFRRKPYLHIGPLMGFLGYLGIALYGNTFEGFFLCLIFANLGLSLTDVATDGFVVEESNDENVTRIQGLTQVSIRVAAFMTSFFSGLLIYAEILTPHQMYLLAAGFPLITFAASFYIREQSVEDWALLEPKTEDSMTLETTYEHYKTKKTDLQVFTPGYIMALIVIFVLIVTNLVFGQQLDDVIQGVIPGFSRTYFTVTIWLLFFVWMAGYFGKLVKLKLTTSMIFIAILFILLWRFNPGTGASMFFFVKDTLGIDEKTLGFMDTVAQIGSLLGVFLAVKIFDKIPLRTLLTMTVIVASAFGLTSFAVTRPEIGELLGNTALIGWAGMIIASPVYFFDSLFQYLIAGQEYVGAWAAVYQLSAMEKFLYAKSIVDELVFMIAYIPLLKLAVLICPKRAEATNYAIIASIMNIGLALSAWTSGFLYNTFMGWYHPGVDVSTVQVDVIELLIWVNVITSLFCLFVIPFLKTDRFHKE